MKKYEFNGFTLYHIPNKKFKTLTVGAYFLRPLTKEGMVESAILANILMKYNQKYPTEQLHARYLEELYGTTLYVAFNRHALINSMSFIIKLINDEYLFDQNIDLFKDAVNLLNDTIALPVFDNDIFELEKELLIDDIIRINDNKYQKATLNFVQHMYKDELCRHSIASMKERSETVQLDDIINEYNSMLQAKKVFFVIGDIEEERLVNTFSTLSFEKDNITNLEFLDNQTKEIVEVNEVIDQEPNNQSIVMMGYRSEIRETDELYSGMFVLNNMLGGYFHSTLFQEIREKRSLAYSIQSEYNSKKGTFVISAGISANKYEEFKKVVTEILDDYKNGFIDDEIITLTKKMLVNAQYNVADQPSYGMTAITKDLSGSKELSLEEKVQVINNVTKDNLVKCANRLQLDTIYFLEGTK